MIYYDAKDAVKEMRKNGFDIVRCCDCKYHRQYTFWAGFEQDIKYYCNRHECYVKDNDFCPYGIHIEKNKCYECPIAQQYNLEDDDSPCLDCEEE